MVHRTAKMEYSERIDGEKNPPKPFSNAYIPQIIDYFVKFFLYNPVFSVNLRSDIAWPIIDYNNSRVGPLFVQYHIGLKLVLKEHS